MSFEVSAVLAPAPAHTAKSDVHRQSANYHPNIWGDYFLTFQSDFMETNDQIEHHQKLKEEVRSMLIANVDKLPQTMDLIDSIQRLGVSYHFENEIEEILRDMNMNKGDIDDDDNDDLCAISLKFRLLRQHGHNISCDVFKKFKNSKGNFKDSLVNDARGMLSLYEATHLRIHGEDILDEALAFTTTQLESMATTPPLAEQIIHALKQPIRKGLPRLEARHYFSIYEGDASCNQVVLSFAKLDFNILQKQHQNELRDIAKWWKHLNFATKLSFARDRMVECYFWILSVYYEPQYSLARRILTKIISLASVLDDIYDVYGTLEELTLFTDTIQRWDINNIEQLPECMKLCYKALQEVYLEMEEELAKEERLYRIQYAKKAMKEFVQAYYVEAKWLHEGHIPSMEEYMDVALVSCGYPMLTVMSFIGMGDIATEEAFDWVSNYPNLVRAASTISRLMDDIVSYKFEKETGKIASAIECYMKEYGVTKEEEVFNEFNKKIEKAWKDINQELLTPTAALPLPLLMRPLNLARVMDVLYKDGDNYTHVGKVTIDGITSLLIDPVLV